MIGVGLNLTIQPDEFPLELRDTAVSLLGALGKYPEREFQEIDGETGATAVLNRHLDRWVTAERADTLAAWRERDALRGREVAWDGGAGVADGIEDSGDLVVVSGGDRVVLGAGEVHLRL